MFLSEAGEDDKHQLVVRHPNIIDITEGAKTITSSLASRISRSMRMFAETFVNDNHYICKAASISMLTPEKVLEIEKCSW